MCPGTRLSERSRKRGPPVVRSQVVSAHDACGGARCEARGVQEHAPHDTAFNNFHEHVHTGQPSESNPNGIRGVPVGAEC